MTTSNQHKLLIAFVLSGPLLLWLGGFPLPFILKVIVALEIPVILSIFAQMGKYRTLTINCCLLYILAAIVFLGINIKKWISSPADTLNNEVNTALALIGIIFYTIIYFTSKNSYTKIELKKIQQN